MEPLERLLRRVRRRTAVDDDFFGRLNYRHSKSRDWQSYWEGWRLFEPTGRRVDLYIVAPASWALPNEAQRDFFRGVERDHRAMMIELEPQMRWGLNAWIARPPECSILSFDLASKPGSQLPVSPHDAEITPVFFKIPTVSIPEWYMIFESPADPDLMIDVTFHGREPRIMRFCHY